MNAASLNTVSLPAGSPGSSIIGTGSYRPSRVVSNDEICQLIDSSDEWIRERTGIISRRFAGPEETAVTMGIAAARTALDAAQVAPADVDVVITATITHMLQTPAAAPMIADALGATPAAAFDLGAACAGFCHGLGVADSLIRSGVARTVLVIGSEKMTEIIDPTDRSSAFIFADGAGAMVVSATTQPGIGPTIWGSDGGAAETITQDQQWNVLRAPQGRDDLAYPSVKMQGQSVFRWSVFTMPAVARRAVEAAGLTMEDISVFVPHQANDRIIGAMVKQLKLPPTVEVSHDIIHTGNTSGASIPLATDAMLTERPELGGSYALLIGYGAGLSYAAQVVRLPAASGRT